MATGRWQHDTFNDNVISEDNPPTSQGGASVMFNVSDCMKYKIYDFGLASSGKRPYQIK
jgi:hypothetical protein